MSRKSTSNGVFLILMLYERMHHFIDHSPHTETNLIPCSRFLNAELSWSAQKVDDTVLPIIRKVGQRGKVRLPTQFCFVTTTDHRTTHNRNKQPGNANKQSTMDAFFDTSLGSGTAAPRKRAPYASKRLQKVVTDYRKGLQRSKGVGSDSGVDEERESTSSEDERASASSTKKGKAKGKGKGKARLNSNSNGGAARNSSSSRQASPDTSANGGVNPTGKKRKAAASAKKANAATRKRRKAVVPSESESDDEAITGVAEKSVSTNVPDRPLEVKLRPRPKPVYGNSAPQKDDEEMEEDD